MTQTFKLSQNHHEGVRITTNFLLSKWKNGKWLNNFVSKDVATRKSSSDFPSVDWECDDSKTKAVISCEFKPATEKKRGVLTGLGQAIAYLNNADASYLIAPATIDGFDMETYLKETFKNSIKGKLPVGLISFDFDHIKGEYRNIRLSVDIDPSLKCKNQSLKKGKVSYWAIWRDNPTIGVIRFLESCALKTNDTKDKRWEYFFDNYYAPPKTRKNLNPITNDLYMFDPQGNYQIPFDGKKRTIRKYRTKKLTRSQIIKQGKYASVKNDDGKVAKDKLYYFNNISKKETLSQADYMQLLANHGWEDDMHENIYKDYKKNYKNFCSHMCLINEDWSTTPLGDKFLQNVQVIINKTNNINTQSDLSNDELAKILLVQGEHHNLILDLLDAQLAIPEDDDVKTVMQKCEKYMDAKGFLPRNPERKTTGRRKFLQSEKQLWKHLKLIKDNKESNLLTFDMTKIDKLIDSFYKDYGEIYKQ